MLLIFLFSSLFSLAGTTSLNTFESTYPRDNTFCQVGESRIQFQIRGNSRLTEPTERGYGEYLFYQKKEKSFLLTFNKMRADTFRFFKSPQESLCSKSLGYLVGKETIAILFLKENRPFKEKLAIQLFDVRNGIPKDVIETEYMTDKAELFPDGFAFKTFQDRHHSDIGKVKIEEKDFTYHDRNFPVWMSFTPRGFEVMGTLSFKHFPEKRFFKDEADFFEATGWNAGDKRFSNSNAYFAVNHTLKKECLLFLSQKQKISGAEKWRCLQKR